MSNLIRQARRDLHTIEAHGYTELAATNLTALTALEAWHTRGYPQAALGGGTTSGVADPTGTAAATPPDQIAQHLTDLCAAIAAIRRGLDDSDSIRQWTRALKPREVIDALVINRPTGACIDCDAVVAGTRDDRLKAGRCPACYMVWYRRRNPTDQQVVA